MRKGKGRKGQKAVEEKEGEDELVIAKLRSIMKVAGKEEMKGQTTVAEEGEQIEKGRKEGQEGREAVL
jgi:hypothetical protein